MFYHCFYIKTLRVSSIGLDQKSIWPGVLYPRMATSTIWKQYGQGKHLWYFPYIHIPWLQLFSVWCISWTSCGFFSFCSRIFSQSLPYPWTNLDFSHSCKTSSTKICHLLLSTRKHLSLFGLFAFWLHLLLPSSCMRRQRLQSLPDYPLW